MLAEVTTLLPRRSAGWFSRRHSITVCRNLWPRSLRADRPNVDPLRSQIRGLLWLRELLCRKIRNPRIVNVLLAGEWLTLVEN